MVSDLRLGNNRIKKFRKTSEEIQSSNLYGSKYTVAQVFTA